MLGKFKNLSNREKAGLVLATICLFLVAVNYGVVNPLMAYLKEIKEQIKNEKRKIEISNSVIAQESAVDSKFVEAQSKILRVSSYDEATDEMKGHIDDIARRTGLIINAMDHKPAVEKEGIGVCMVEVSQFESDIKGLLQFLHEIRVAEGLLNVEKLIFSVDKEKSTLKGSILISRIVLKESASSSVEQSYR